MPYREPGWDLWRAFNAAMEERTLSSAARRLGLTQPTLGRQIEALEENLGFSLFVRSQKGLTPTEGALGIAPLARSMAATADAMLRTTKGGQNQEQGVVRLTASEIVSTQILPPMLAQFSATYPQIAIELQVSNEVDDLLNREADLAIRMVQPTQKALLAKKLGEVDIKLFAHADYLARRGSPTSIDEIGEHRVIGYDMVRRAFDQIREISPEIDREDFEIRSDNDVAQQMMVAAGAGIGGMMTQIAKQYPDLRPVLHNQLTIPLGVWLVMHEDMRNAGPTRLMFDFLDKSLRAFIRQP